MMALSYPYALYGMYLVFRNRKTSMIYDAATAKSKKDDTSSSSSSSSQSPVPLVVILMVCIGFVIAFSLQAHKEFRFMLPIVPFLIIFSAIGWDQHANKHMKSAMIAIVAMTITSVMMTAYFSMVHQRGTVDAVRYLSDAASAGASGTVLMALPCHSYPFQSVIHSRSFDIKTLDCAPPEKYVSRS